MIVDRNGVELKVGQLVLRYQDDGGPYYAEVVELFPDQPTTNHNGFWVDIDAGDGVQGIMSYMLEVVGEPDKGDDALFHFLCFIPFVLISGVVSWKLFEVLWKSWSDTDPSGIAGAGFILIGFMFLCVSAFFCFCVAAMVNPRWFHEGPR
jgi:hypothetical protein